MSNLSIYEKVSAVPDNAKKTIGAGRLKGMTDINPMWRIKVLTEMFGVCGFGWKYKITNKQIIDGANDTKCAFVDIDMFIKVDGEWSDAIQGTGGSSFISAEKNGLYTSDECFKMALTDAISVACKAIGVGADVYWQAGRTKYNQSAEPQQKQPTLSDRIKEAAIKTGKQPQELAKELCSGLSIASVRDIKASDLPKAFEILKGVENEKNS